MYYAESISLSQAEPLLSQCGLKRPSDADYTAGVFDDIGKLLATGSLAGDMIQGVAVDPAHQGEDLTGKLMTHLISTAAEKGTHALYLFTKPEKAIQFQGLGFRTVATARPYAALLEWGSPGIEGYRERLTAIRRNAELSYYMEKSGGHQLMAVPDCRIPAPRAAALVMNCNPFTKGHRWLVEKAATENDLVYLLVVEENKSLFSFDNRLAMVRRGTKDLPGVIVIPGSRYCVSSLTFPSYFTKEENLAKAQTAMDAEIFCRHIAPQLGITRRYIGTEPLSPVTAVYNETLKSRLPKDGIEVLEIPRLEKDGQPVSASRVRELLGENPDSLTNPSPQLISSLSELVPQSTLNYLLEEVSEGEVKPMRSMKEESNR